MAESIPSISFVIPVYNLEEHISHCVDSILNQGKADIEIVLVNDGSKDNSANICNEYARIYNFIRVFHQENSGVSVARNLGIKKAKGTWICFIDGDDFLAEGCIPEFISSYKNDKSDFIVAKSFIFENNSKGEERYPLKRILLNKKISGFELMSQYRYTRGSVCGCFFKRSFLDEFIIQFPEGLRNAEDSLFFLLCLAYGKQIKFFNKDVYFIHKRLGSASRSWSTERIFTMTKGLDFLYDRIEADKELTEQEESILNYGLFVITRKMIIMGYYHIPFYQVFPLWFRIAKTLKGKINTGEVGGKKRGIKVLNKSIFIFIMMTYIQLMLKKNKA